MFYKRKQIKENCFKITKRKANKKIRGRGSRPGLKA
jgi:hypothetical protein